MPVETRWRALWVVLGCLVCQMGLGYGYVFGPLAVDIIDELGWTRTMYSSARAPQLFVIAAVSPLVGPLLARFGARRLLSGSVLLLGTTFFLLSGLQQLWQLYGLVILHGLVVVGLGDIAVGQVVSNWTTRARGLALGVVYAGSNLGGALLSRVAASIADASSWRDAFASIGIGGLIVMLPFAAWAVREPRRAPLVAVEDATPRANEDAASLDLSEVVRTRSFWILVVALFAFFFYFLGMLEHLVLFLVDSGLTRAEATAYFSNAILIGIAGKLGFGFVADRISHKAALLLDYGLLTASAVLLFAIPHPVWLPIFVVTYGFATAARDVVYPLIISRCFGVRYLAHIYGAVMLALAPGGALGPIFAAAVFDATGSYQVAFATFAALNLASLLALGFVRDERTGAPIR